MKENSKGGQQLFGEQFEVFDEVMYDVCFFGKIGLLFLDSLGQKVNMGYGLKKGVYSGQFMGLLGFRIG